MMHRIGKLITASSSTLQTCFMYNIYCKKKVPITQVCTKLYYSSSPLPHKEANVLPETSIIKEGVLNTNISASEKHSTSMIKSNDKSELSNNDNKLTTEKEEEEEEEKEFEKLSFLEEAKVIKRTNCNRQLYELLESMEPCANSTEIVIMIKNAKNAKDIKTLLENVIYKHPLCFDLLNGHGFRVTVLQSLTNSAVRTESLFEWFDCTAKFRKLGFKLTRTFITEGFGTIRQWIMQQFRSLGRSPHIVSEGLAHVKELMQWCHEDDVVFDHVLYTRIIYIITLIASYFDRQNLYRNSFPPDLCKRDGVVVEWVITHERSLDFDECVLQCDAVMEEILERIRNDIPSRPSFSLSYRIIDYYFTTDNVEKMIAVMEDISSYGVSIAESSTAKLMQLACAFNLPQVPELLIRWRIALPQCVMATPDMSRLLFYYCKSGGGLPCPVCNETFNHRNVGVYQWLATPPHQRQCPLLAMARRRKGEFEELTSTPQTRDWSREAFALWELSQSRAIEWGATEWRGFLCCCMFSPRALTAKKLMDEHCDVTKMDDFLRSVYVRLCKHYCPDEVLPSLEVWRNQYKITLSPIVLQEALIALLKIKNKNSRLHALKKVSEWVYERDAYVMPYTKRCIWSKKEQLKEKKELTPEEEELMNKMINLNPRHHSLLELKDSASDYAPGVSKKNTYVSKAIINASAARIAQYQKN